MKRSMIIELKAPFLSYRAFNSGGYQYTLPIIPPSSAYGILCGLAGIEIKETKPVKYGGGYFYYPNGNSLPKLDLAIGLVEQGKLGKLLHQHHKFISTPSYNKICPNCSEKKNIEIVDLELSKCQCLSCNTIFTAKLSPGGSITAAELKKEYKGRKFSIGTINREYISNFHGVIAVRADEAFLSKIIEGIKDGEFVPYAGQRNLFFSHIGKIDGIEARWYTKRRDEMNARTILLPVKVVRHDSTQTVNEAFCVTESLQSPPESAWVSYG